MNKETIKFIDLFCGIGGFRIAFEEACEENEIQESDLRFGPAVTPEETVKNLNLEATEKHLIQLALKKHTGNVSKAAKELGITRAALYRRMEKHNL